MLNDSYERKVERGLFGALVQGQAHRLDVKLDLPDIENSVSTIDRTRKKTSVEVSHQQILK